MGIIIDIVLIAIVALNIFIGYRKGLVRLAVELVAVLVSVVLAVMLYRPISNVIIEKTGIDESIENIVVEKFISEEEDVLVEDKSLITYLEGYVNDSVDQTVMSMSSFIATKAINIGVILGIFVIVRLIMFLLTFVTDFITELPILKQFDAAGGIAYGAIKALLIIYIVLAVLFFIISITGNSSIKDLIDSTFVTKLFYNNNILLNILF